MLSRVADSIYWMARYVERAENLARFVEVAMNFSLDQPDSGVEQWEPLIRATGDDDEFLEACSDFSEANVRQFLTFDGDYHSSILTSVTNARENARTVREAISSEAWEQLNALYHFVRTAAGAGSAMSVDATFYDAVVQYCYHFTGILDATMTRGTGWNFANIGRHLERADKTSRILDVKYFTLLRHVSDVDTPIDDLLWSTVLRSACGFEMYRKRFHSVTVERIADFLILEDEFPRAIRYCIRQVQNSLLTIAAPVEPEVNSAILQTNEMLDDLNGLSPRAIIQRGMHEAIDSLQSRMNQVALAIHDTYFAHRTFPGPQMQSLMQSQTQLQSAGR
ncbi:MAG: alpha-E domain-containing protein [Planctomycetaceae bacterium]